MRPELMNEHMISLSNDTVAVVDMAEKGKGKTAPACEHTQYLLARAAIMQQGQCQS